MLTRDDIIRMMDWHPSFDRNQTDGLLARIERVAKAAADAEREACAKVCEETTAAWTQPVYNGACMDCAAAIRARGTQDPKVTHLNEWARDRLARHGIQIPEDDDANPSF